MYNHFCPYLRLLPLKKHVEIFVLKTVSNYTIKSTRKPRHFYQIQLIFEQKTIGSDRRLWIGSARTKIGSDRSTFEKIGSDRDRIGRLLKRLDRIGNRSDPIPIQLCRPLPCTGNVSQGISEHKVID
jgi:hypothetical protein